MIARVEIEKAESSPGYIWFESLLATTPLPPHQPHQHDLFTLADAKHIPVNRMEALSSMLMVAADPSSFLRLFELLQVFSCPSVHTVLIVSCAPEK